MKRGWILRVFIIWLVTLSLFINTLSLAASEEYEAELEKYAKLTEVVSGGRNSSNRVFIQVGNHVFFDNIPHSRDTAGLYVVGILDDKILLQSQYSMFGDGQASIKLSRDIERLPQNTFVVVASKDEPTRNFNQTAQEALYQIGAERGLLNRESRSSYLCLGIKGMARGNAIEKVGIQELTYAGTELGKALKFIFPSKPETVTFADQKLETAIRETARIPAGRPVTTKHLNDMIGFRVGYRDIVNLGGIEYGSVWRHLELRGNRISDISLISRLKNLKELHLGENEIVDVAPLSGLISLEDLNLGTNKIRDLSPIAELSNLKIFRVAKNEIRNISPLGKLSKMEILDFGNNQVRVIDAISNMKNLTYLHVPFNQIEDVTPLSKLYKLEALFIDRNNIKDVSSLSNLVNLEIFFIRDNMLIQDISVVSNMKKLKHLSFYRNQIHDIFPVAGLTDLVILEAGKNPIKDISPITGLTNLKTLTLRETQVANFSPLSKLTKLVDLDLRGTGIGNLVPISKCWKLENLNLPYCQLENITTLAKLPNLKRLVLFRNRIRNIIPLTRLENLEYLDIRSNPLSDKDYKICIPKILRNNPNIELLSDRINTQKEERTSLSH